MSEIHFTAINYSNRLQQSSVFSLQSEANTITLSAVLCLPLWPRYFHTSALRGAVEIESFEEQVKQLVAKLSVAEAAEVSQLARELRRLLWQHEKFVRCMAARVAEKVKDDPPTAKAA